MTWLDDNATTTSDPRPKPAVDLVGPEDADNFRVKVGRYGERWYTDPLPADDSFAASEWQGPSVSAVKPPFANKYVPLRTVADLDSTEWARLAGVSAVDRYEAVKAADKASGRVNMRRGTLVHWWAEDLVAGRPMRPLTGEEPAVVAQTEPFRAPLESFFDAYQPEPLAVEVVCLHRTMNGVGYGGTADIFARIDGEVWAIDWKSRTSKHGAYMEEAAQGGAYVGAEYMIVADGDVGAKRVPVPDVAGVLIVSITAEGYRCYPIERAGAVAVFEQMHAWWAAQRTFTGDKVIGRPWAPRAAGAKPAATPAPTESADSASGLDWLRRRIGALIEAGHRDDMAKHWPEGVPTLASGTPLTDDQIAQLDKSVSRIEARHEMTFLGSEPLQRRAPVEPAAVEPEPDDGDTIAQDAADELRARIAALPANRAEAIAIIAAEANTAGRTISVTAKPCVRRWEIARALVLWAESGSTDAGLWFATAQIATTEQTAFGDDTLGALISRFTIEQAQQLADAYTTPGVDATDQAAPAA